MLAGLTVLRFNSAGVYDIYLVIARPINLAMIWASQALSAISAGLDLCSLIEPSFYLVIAG